MGGGNLGDDTTQTAVMCNIRSRWPDAIIYGFSMNPADTKSAACYPRLSDPAQDMGQSRPGSGRASGLADNGRLRTGGRVWLASLLGAIAAVTVRKPQAAFAELIFLVRSLAIMRTLDIFVISGGGQLLDSWGGTWDYPFTIFKWVVLAKLSGTKCYFVNVGAGPLKHPLSKFFITRALALADYVSFRDQKSDPSQRDRLQGRCPGFPRLRLWPRPSLDRHDKEWSAERADCRGVSHGLLRPSPLLAPDQGPLRGLCSTSWSCSASGSVGVIGGAVQHRHLV